MGAPFGQQILSLRRSRSVALLFVASLVLSVVLAACGEAAVKSSPGVPARSAIAPAAAPAAQQSAGGASTETNASPSSSQSSTEQLPPISRMVVHNAQLSLQVPDVNQALARISDIAQSHGGYVSTEHAYASQSDDQTRTVADVTIRVRADEYDQALGQLRGLATKVVSVDETSDDVTQQYIDVDANLRNLQASESAILKLMNQTTNINDILTLQRELTNVRGQIQRLQAQEQYLERQTSLSTITMHLEPPAVAQSSPLGPFWDPLATLARGWHDSLTVLRVLVDALLYVASAFWWAIILAGAGIYFERKRRQARRAAVGVGPTNPS